LTIPVIFTAIFDVIVIPLDRCHTLDPVYRNPEKKREKKRGWVE